MNGFAWLWSAETAEAVDEAIVDTIRAEMKKWWPAFPERRLLTERPV